MRPRDVRNEKGGRMPEKSKPSKDSDKEKRRTKDAEVPEPSEESKDRTEGPKERPGETKEGPDESQARTKEPLKVKDVILLLIVELSNRAWAYMGKVAHPETGEPTVDLEQARLAIDALEALFEASKGHMDEKEAKSVESTLSNLRVNFVSVK
jgi:hypothetical protein